jgi:hypothetical protein
VVDYPFIRRDVPGKMENGPVPILLAHLIGHGWRDLLVYGSAALAMLAGFMVYSSGRAARLHGDGADDADDDVGPRPAEQPLEPPLIRRRDAE